MNSGYWLTPSQYWRSYAELVAIGIAILIVEKIETMKSAILTVAVALALCLRWGLMIVCAAIEA